MEDDTITVAGAPFRAMQSDISETLKIVRAMSIATSHNADEIAVLKHGQERHSNQLADDDKRILENRARIVKLEAPGARARLGAIAFALMLAAATIALAAASALR